jgi:hypothetical protein
VIREAPIPSEPVIFIANHANDYGPMAMLFSAERSFRAWSSANMLSLKTAPDQIMKTIFPNAEKLFPLCRVLSYLMAPVMCGIFKASGVIPVYRDIRVKTTFAKTIETLKEGLDVVIFPDSLIPDPDNEYMDTIQKGAFKTFGICRKHIGKAPYAVPVYCCKALDIVCVGTPIAFDTDLEDSEAEEKLIKQVGNEIKRLALSLPTHKVTHYAVMPRNIEKIKKYLTYNEEKIYNELLKNQETENNDILKN